VDLNQLYFDHQLLLMKAKRTPSAETRRAHETGASLIAGRIGCVQRALGASGAQAWEAVAANRHGSPGSPPQHQFGYAS
jgi:hypothetical protein